MNSLSNFHFLRPAWLLLLPLLLWLWWLSLKRLDPLAGWRSMMDSRLLAAMTVGNANQAGRASTRLLMAWIIAAVSLAGPAWWPEPSPFSDDPVPVMLVLKAGETMELTDFSPSRMERARLKAVDFAEARGHEPLGLIAYAGSAHLVLPPTRDTLVVGDMAAEISPEIMPQQGDELGEALKLAKESLEGKGGSVVVILDTIATPESATLRDFADASRIPIHFLAVARQDTPEIDGIRSAASILKASVTLMTSDAQDIQTIIRAVAGNPQAVGSTADGVRWAEAGWWLIPVLAALSLMGFRREVQGPTEKDIL